MTGCYCQLLGINPYKESEYNDQALEKAIEAAKNRWNAEKNAFDENVRYDADSNLNQLEDIYERMSYPKTRAEEFEKGRELLKSYLQPILNYCVVTEDGKAYAFQTALKGQIARLAWPGITEKDAAEILDLGEGSPPLPIGRKAADEYRKLSDMGYHTPAQVLNYLISKLQIANCHPLSDASPAVSVREAITACVPKLEMDRKNFPGHKTYLDCVRRLKYMSDKDLEELIEYGRCRQDLSQVTERLKLEYNDRITRKQIDDLLETFRVSDQKMAIPALESFCYENGLAADFSGTRSESIRCPFCKNFISGSEDVSYCPICKRKIKKKCRRCGTVQSNQNKICVSCGFDFDNEMKNATKLGAAVRDFIDMGDFKKAEMALAELERDYSEIIKTEVLESEIDSSKKIMSTLTKLMDDAYSSGRYCHFLDLCGKLHSEFPGAIENDIDLREKIRVAEERCKLAEKACEEAADKTTHEEKLMLYVKASDHCKDWPESRDYLMAYPPDNVVDCDGTTKDGVVRISFTPPSDTKDVVYCIWRGEGSEPYADENTKPYEVISKHKLDSYYEDKNVESGVKYYYLLCTRRWGILSSPMKLIGPLVPFEPVDKVNIVRTEDGFHITFARPKKSIGVLIRRYVKDEDDRYVEHEIKNAEEYDDICLRGTTYYYQFFAEYFVDGRIELSDKNVQSASSMELPPPVTDLKVNRNRNGTYTARWTSSMEAKLYRSERKLKFNSRVMMMDDVRSLMKEVEPVDNYSDGISFSMDGGAIWYLFPIIQVGKTAVRGDEVCVINLEPFKNIERTVKDGDCIITMDWPQSALGAELRISDVNVADSEDPRLMVRSVSRKEYEDKRQIVVPMGKSTTKFVYIFAKYKYEDEIRLSHPTMISAFSASCRKVRYSASRDRKSISFRIQTDPGVDSIPEIMAVQSDGRFPLRSGDGKTVWKSGGAVSLSGGTATVSFAAEPQMEVEKMRLFFCEESNYNIFKFIHPLYRRD